MSSRTAEPSHEEMLIQTVTFIPAKVLSLSNLRPGALVPFLGFGVYRFGP